MRIIYPTDFVRTDFSRTDEMPYRKKSVSMILIFIRFLCFFTCGKQNYTCRKQNEVSKFVHVVCDLRNMAMCRRNLQLKLLKAMVEENDSTLVLEKKILKGFYHLWAWRPSWSCDPDPANKLSFPHPTEAPYEIWL